MAYFLIYFFDIFPICTQKNVQKKMCSVFWCIEFLLYYCIYIQHSKDLTNKFKAYIYIFISTMYACVSFINKTGICIMPEPSKLITAMNFKKKKSTVM